MDEYVGIVKPFAGAFAPRGWQICDGTALPISGNELLYAIIGTTYGGDGSTTFKVPDLRGVVPVGIGPQSPYEIGERGGTETITLTAANLPPHSHPLTGGLQLLSNADAAATADPSNAYPAASSGSMYTSAATGASEPMGPVLNTLSTGVQGMGQAIDNMSPYTAITYIICVQGYFPPRN